MARALATPSTLAEALRLAADLAERNEELEKQLKKLQQSQYPEVLQSKHIIELMGWSKATLTFAANDPTFPHLDGSRKKGEAIRCLKWEFYEWLKSRR
ncbi:hypothetical protein DMN77_18840 [Paenibacillus sp. 79R4]|uniref:hypothetical protein n=1 Tax=Paenibacillus sp. 79R4 TaxID=2212847 RepID=UPI0015B99B4E|nr:hypothetical protein [Paenibacillus sp. 79R4]NWL89608.1 hypothetical protein [Paenibacillus sp. 79R4]